MVALLTSLCIIGYCQVTTQIESDHSSSSDKDHRLILLDSRGHGESDKPHDPAAYDLGLRALDVLAVLDDLSIRKSDYFGYSLGGECALPRRRFLPSPTS
ncbi:MAG: alpha/beta fold hydrolase [Tardiphaga sp.]